MGGRITFATTVMALAPFSIGYFLSYLFRAVNAIIEKDLVADIGLGPAELGLVTAAYLGAFALFQLPLGLGLFPAGVARSSALGSPCQVGAPEQCSLGPKARAT